MDGYRGGPWSVFYQLGDERAKQTMMWGYAGEYLASDGGEADERDWAFLADGVSGFIVALMWVDGTDVTLMNV